LFVRNKVTGVSISQALLHPLDDIEVVEDILQTAVVRKTIKQFPHLCFHFCHG